MRKLSLAALISLFFINSNIYAQGDTTKKQITHRPELFLCTVDSGLKVINPRCENCKINWNRYNYIIAKSCAYIQARDGHAITPKYFCVFDQRYGTLDYLKLKNGKGYEKFKPKKQIQPKANREMYVIVIAKDSDYFVKTESEEYFMEYEQQFANTIAKANSDTSTTNSATASGKDDPNLASLPNDKAKNFDFESLNDALTILVNRYPEKSIIDEMYYSDLMCLRLNIQFQLGSRYFIVDTGAVTITALTHETEDLIEQLKKQANGDTSLLIPSIKTKYFYFITRQLHKYLVRATQIQIPDKDAFKFSINQKKNGETEILSRNFKVSEGFKIDFSVGTFLTGLGVPEYVVQSHSFKYKQANFSVNPTTGGIDTVFTGNIIDTTGNLIHTKDPRVNYAVGFLCHAYVRTGTFANLGIATGLIVNNDGFQMLLGGSLMLNIRKSRIAFSGGMALGNRKTLSPTVERSQWNDSYKDGQVFRTAGEVPQFVGTTDPPTYNKWKRSWYFGLTYNFNSVNVRL